MNFTEEYKSMVKKDFDEWLNHGNCQRALDLNTKINEEYFDAANPHFFTGDLKSELVLIHLNPKRNKDQYGKKCSFKTFDEYWNFYTSFGANHYGLKSNRTHKSPFDHKQVRFLRPFNVIPFKDDDIYHNLEVVIDKKLQLELIPFGSPSFDYRTIGVNNLKPLIENSLNLILSAKRKYVLFCGRVFCQLLSSFIINETTHIFKLRKNDGTETRDDFELIKIKLKVGNEILDAAIAPQFAKQGAPVSRYGEKIFELYDN